MTRKLTSEQISAWLINFLLLVAIVLLVVIIYQFVVLPAPPKTGDLPVQSPDPTILDKLGPQTAVAVIMVLVGLVAWVFWLFIQFGRRLSERGYLGPLTSDGLARAEMARCEATLKEDLAAGVFVADIDIYDPEFRKRYRLPEGVDPPELVPGVKVDETGHILQSEQAWGWGTGDGTLSLGSAGGGGSSKAYLYRNYAAPALLQALQTAQTANDAGTVWAIERELDNRFTEGYQAAQLETYHHKRAEMREQARAHAASLLPGIDASAFGGGWVFVLEFTTIIFIVFTALVLGFVGVLGAEQIGTILAAIAGYVLGKSTTLRGAGGQELIRGAEEPKALMETLAKQAEVKAQTDAEKLKLQQQVAELQGQVAQNQVLVPNVVNQPAAEAVRLIKEKGLVAESKEVVNPTATAGVVFDQMPTANSEAAKGSAVVCFVAQAVAPPPAEDDGSA